ncbi:major facilitator superfamily domain-containing protein [Pelagophyceae sp. CCMP2097]|nr:major facilitator superfamily domain-containing protein [Pelagophyceae sp. CCMP2097]
MCRVALDAGPSSDDLTARILDIDVAVRPKEPSRVKTVAALMCFISVASFSSTMPFQQSKRDSLGCGPLCIGSMTSARSALTLVGAPVMGRASDTIGRRAALLVAACATVSSATIQAHAGSIDALWVAMVPAALFNHQYDVLKATLADAYDGQSASTLGGAQGTLGMAAGIGFLGVSLGGFCADSKRATFVALLGFICSILGTFALPQKTVAPLLEKEGPKDGFFAAVRKMASLPSARSPAGLLLLALRLLMGLAFHAFMAIWQTSLRTRFPGFGPSDTAKFLTFIGLGYAASQGAVARPLLGLADRTRNMPLLLIACCAALSLGRIAAFLSPTVPGIYVAYAPVIVALGVVNAAVTGAASSAAPPNERGGFIGILSAVESVCGIFGPVLGGVVSLFGPRHVLALVVVLYVAAGTLIAVFWQEHISAPKKAEEQAGKAAEKKISPRLTLGHLAVAYFGALLAVAVASYVKFTPQALDFLTPVPPAPPKAVGLRALLQRLPFPKRKRP